MPAATATTWSTALSAEGEVIPGGTVTLSIAAVVGELDALADRARHHGGGEVEGPADRQLG